MFDARLLPLVRRALAPVADLCVKQGIRADQITLTGFAVGALAVPALVLEAYVWALAFILLNRMLDGLDGEVARRLGATDRGAFLDVALDFVFYALVPLGFALANPDDNALAAAVLIASFVGTGSSFLAFSVIAERRGLTSEAYPSKGIFYLGGLTEGAETIALFVIFCLFPAAFAPLALGYAALCTLTTVTRWLAGWRMF